jgi:DNA topoisomerase IB
MTTTDVRPAEIVVGAIQEVLLEAQLTCVTDGEPGLARRRNDEGFANVGADLIRVGNDAYARLNDSYGLTTLQGEHVEIEGAELRFRFTGKSDKVWQPRSSRRSRHASATRRRSAAGATCIRRF